MVLLLTLANQSAMTPSGKPDGDDEASTFNKMEALRVSGQWAKLEMTWAAERFVGILLLSRNCVRWQLFLFSAGKMPLARSRLNFFCPWDCSALSHVGGLSALRSGRAEEPRNS